MLLGIRIDGCGDTGRRHSISSPLSSAGDMGGWSVGAYLKPGVLRSGVYRRTTLDRVMLM